MIGLYCGGIIIHQVSSSVARRLQRILCLSFVTMASRATVDMENLNLLETALCYEFRTRTWQSENRQTKELQRVIRKSRMLSFYATLATLASHPVYSRSLIAICITVLESISCFIRQPHPNHQSLSHSPHSVHVKYHLLSHSLSVFHSELKTPLKLINNGAFDR